MRGGIVRAEGRKGKVREKEFEREKLRLCSKLIEIEASRRGEREMGRAARESKRKRSGEKRIEGSKRFEKRLRLVSTIDR